MVAIQQEGEGAGGGVSTGGSRGSDRLPPPRAGEGWGWGRVMSVQLMGCRLWAAPIPAFPRKRGRGRWWRFNKRGRGGRWRFNRRQQGQVFGEQEGPHLAGLLSGHANRDQSRAASSASAAASFTAPAASAAASRVASAAWSAACSASAAA